MAPAPHQPSEAAKGPIRGWQYGLSITDLTEFALIAAALLLLIRLAGRPWKKPYLLWPLRLLASAPALLFGVAFIHGALYPTPPDLPPFGLIATRRLTEAAFDWGVAGMGALLIAADMAMLAATWSGVRRKNLSDRPWSWRRFGKLFLLAFVVITLGMAVPVGLTGGPGLHTAGAMWEASAILAVLLAGLLEIASSAMATAK